MSEIAPSYLDVWQREQKIDPEVRRTLDKALGPAPARAPRLRIEPGACYQPELLEKGGRVWGSADTAVGPASICSDCAVAEHDRGPGG